MADPLPSPILLITSPRTASNLLVRILALDKQENVIANPHLGGYCFMAASRFQESHGLRDKRLSEWAAHEKTRVNETFQSCFNALEENVAKAKDEGKILFTKEHAIMLCQPEAQSQFLFGEASESSPWRIDIPSTYGAEEQTSFCSPLNWTVLPDAYLRAWKPVFLIRYPALAFPSYYRTWLRDPEASDTNVESGRGRLIMTLHWTRRLYDWYIQQQTQGHIVSEPIVLDADDVMLQPNVVVQLCNLTGLDPSKIQLTWPKFSSDELKDKSERERRMLSTLYGSDGIILDRMASEIDLGVEAKKWRHEFGVEQGAKLEKLIKAAMPDYEYLKAKRLRP